jgi:hypothetical protein
MAKQSSTERNATRRARYKKVRVTRREQIRHNAAVQRAYVDALKQRPCTDCARTYPPCVMDFDHVRGTKRNNIARLISRTCSLQTLSAELDKCELVCANCHRMRTKYGRR